MPENKAARFLFTGVGVVTPPHLLVEDLWQQVLSRGRSVRRGLRRIQSGFLSTTGGSVFVVDLTEFRDRAPAGDPLAEDRDWATLPTHFDYGCTARVSLDRQPFVPPARPRPPSPPALDALLAYAFRLLRLFLLAASGMLLALLIRAGRVWVDFRPARSPGRLIRCGGQITRGPDTSRMTQFPVIRGVPLVRR